MQVQDIKRASRKADKTERLRTKFVRLGWEMRFSGLAGELRKYLFLGTTDGEFVLCLVDSILREPASIYETTQDDRGYLNPLRSVSVDTCRKYLSGDANISMRNASKICGRFDDDNLTELIDGLPPRQKEQLIDFLKDCNLHVEVPDLGKAIADLLEQIFEGIATHQNEINVRVRIYDKKPRIDSIEVDRVRYDKESNKIIIDGESISLPLLLTEDDIDKNKSRFISALCAAYADAMQEIVNVDNIDKLPIKYRDNFDDQVEAYLSAEGIQRFMREIYDDAQNQFDILKMDTYYGIQTTYKDDYPDGFKRLKEVLKQVTNVELNASKLMLIKNLIGSLQKLGIVHILVEDGIIPSWVNPYCETTHE